MVTNILDFTERTVVNIWDDKEDEEGRRPNSVFVQLYKNGVTYGESVELNAENNWQYTWTDLSATNGINYDKYSVEELDVDGYESRVEVIYNVDGSDEDAVKDDSNERAYIISNSLIKPDPVEDKVSITGRKVWIGGPYTKPTIELQLYRNGQAYGPSVELRNGVSAYTWDDLDAKDSQGRKYVYTVKELYVPNNYDSQVLSNGTTVVNTWIDYGIPPSPGTPWDPGVFPIFPWEPIDPKPVDPWTPTDPDTPIVGPIRPEESIDDPIDKPIKDDVIEEPTTKPVEVDKTRPTRIPKTGDENMLVFYGVVFVFSLVALGITIFRRNKKMR